MSKNSQNLLQGTNNAIVSSNKQSMKTLDYITLKKNSGEDVQNFTRPVSGETVKKAIDQLVDDINTNIIVSLNNNSGTELIRIKVLEEAIGNKSRGLQKQLDDLKTKVSEISPEDAPTGGLDIL
ncbi:MULTISPECIES: hypothetical protein [unclassified Wolbachia]|uniref:hypothetical protein n=1 Tax=unclassified Wolbachia TaxID=2640676 RepID=UPI003132A404